MSIRVVISDLSLTGHPESVRDGILSGYGAGLTQDEIEICDSGFVADIAHAQSVGAIAVVRSISDLNDCIATALLYQPTIQTFMAFLSNTYQEEMTPTTLTNIVTVGAGLEANETAYGAGLEFWDGDLDLIEPELSSFSNGRVAGKILKIKDTLNCAWNIARYHAQMTASNLGLWNKYNGFGKIDVVAAIAYVIPKQIRTIKSTLTVV
jgi:hypothetical protein